MTSVGLYTPRNQPPELAEDLGVAHLFATHACSVMTPMLSTDSAVAAAAAGHNPVMVMLEAMMTKTT